MVDAFTIISLCALIISEILPFIKDHNANGILHFVLNCCDIVLQSTSATAHTTTTTSTLELHELDTK